jgi:hypothetical protein
MTASINGFYAAYFTGSSSQGFALLVFRNGTVVGVDTGGLKYDGTYTNTKDGFTVKLNLLIPPNTQLVQGVSSGPTGETAELEFQIPTDFLSQQFIRINGKHGPINVKLAKLRELNDE